jgi:hypothetical protein
MKKIISIIIFATVAAGLFGLMHQIQTSKELDIKDLERIVEKEIKVIKDFKKKHIDSH